MTGIKLEKISDIDKYLFIEKGLRGGISYIAKVHAKANNKYINDYDPQKQSTFISYLDTNNLYGWAMSESTYSTHQIFGKDYAAIHETKPVLILNIPIYFRFTALDLSK